MPPFLAFPSDSDPCYLLSLGHLGINQFCRVSLSNLSIIISTNKSNNHHDTFILRSNSSDESESDLLSFVPPIRSRPISEIDHEELPRNKAIFFIESDLNATRSSFLGSCAFESAARQNPKVPIYLLVDSQSQNFGMGKFITVET